MHASLANLSTHDNRPIAFNKLQMIDSFIYGSIVLNYCIRCQTKECIVHLQIHTNMSLAFYPLMMVCRTASNRAKHAHVCRMAQLWLGTKVWGFLGPVPFDIWGRDYPKAKEGAIGYTYTDYRPCGYVRSSVAGATNKRPKKEKTTTKEEKNTKHE